MRSSTGEPRRGAVAEFFSLDRGATVRLALTLLLGACAFLAPRVGDTGAYFTDSDEVPATLRTAPDFDPEPESEPEPAPTPTVQSTPAVQPGPEPLDGAPVGPGIAETSGEPDGR